MPFTAYKISKSVLKHEIHGQPRFWIMIFSTQQVHARLVYIPTTQIIQLAEKKQDFFFFLRQKVNSNNPIHKYTGLRVPKLKKISTKCIIWLHVATIIPFIYLFISCWGLSEVHEIIKPQSSRKSISLDDPFYVKALLIRWSEYSAEKLKMNFGKHRTVTVSEQQRVISESLSFITMCWNVGWDGDDLTFPWK